MDVDSPVGSLFRSLIREMESLLSSFPSGYGGVSSHAQCSFLVASVLHAAARTRLLAGLNLVRPLGPGLAAPPPRLPPRLRAESYLEARSAWTVDCPFPELRSFQRWRSTRRRRSPRRPRLCAFVLQHAGHPQPLNGAADVTPMPQFSPSSTALLLSIVGGVHVGQTITEAIVGRDAKAHLFAGGLLGNGPSVKC